MKAPCEFIDVPDADNPGWYKRDVSNDARPNGANDVAVRALNAVSKVMRENPVFLRSLVEHGDYLLISCLDAIRRPSTI